VNCTPIRRRGGEVFQHPCRLGIDVIVAGADYDCGLDRYALTGIDLGLQPALLFSASSAARALSGSMSPIE
jgi:hypothetical protein